MTLAAATIAQGLEVGSGILGRQLAGFHLAARRDQQQQQVDRALADVFILLLFEMTRKDAPERLALPNLEIGNLVHAYHPQPLGSQIRGMAGAPEDLRGTLLELNIQAGSLPVARAVRPPIDRV